MSLNSQIKIDIPDHGCVLKKNGAHTYVYYATKTYRNEKGQPTCDRVSIGKYDEVTGKMIPNRNYYEVFQKEPVAFPSTIESYGINAVVNAIAHETKLDTTLSKAFPNDKDIILSIAQYMLENGNAMYYVPDWQNENITNYKKVLSSSKISELFQGISIEERNYFFREWVKTAKQKELIAYDVTSISSYSKNIPELEWGYNRDKEKLPQINFAMYYGEESGTPLYYRIYPGSINDKTHLPYIMEDTDIIKTKKLCVVMDRGFFSAENFDYLIKEKGCRFLMALPSVGLVNEIIDKHIDEVVNHFECLLDNSLIYGKKFESTKLGYRINIHIYYDPVKAVQDTAAFQAKIQKLEEEIPKLTKMPDKTSNYCKYFDIQNEDGVFQGTRNADAINKALKRCGTFAIADTVFNRTTKEILDIYRRRDTIEKAFDDLKNAEGMGRTYCHSTKSVEGKAFVAFIALIIRSYMLKKLRSYMEEKNFTLKKILIELAKIKQVYAPNMPNNARLLNPVTKTQREILENLGFSEELVKNIQ